mmetsp:Transcript_63965/g.74397  ORF Transcript_63965/g.74397 Transcript_63965/m.74397 type:complete len:130 (+) Transcript_63965:39-428(+)|eukprot:CAMPEP_0176431602 /NCGR_PEP_ID=MMETSP0127-20121128/14900_1 /TAXON_ID=938130 /ORGANISM="Platyophrya macrostoma, Strain WH" /LENGTH=129 /DNA_ID=CAMNT_0017813621 /DNA_START=20 /DNA_END=409 /DNA_ORIENTATION=+
MNKKGGGIAYVNEFQSDEMRLFRGGLRHNGVMPSKLIKDTRDSVRNYHDKFSYERGFVQHSRSPANQYLAFHFMYGGFRTYVLQRHFYQNWYRRGIRNYWFPILFSYTLGGMTMRMYDNASYDYFYFSD